MISQMIHSARSRLRQLLTLEETDLPEREDPMMTTARHIILSLAAMLSLTLLVYVFQVPNPNMLLITGLTVFTALFGYPAGIVCGLEMLVYSLYFFSTDHNMVTFTAVNVQKTATVVLGIVLNVIFIGHLKHASLQVHQQLIEVNGLLRRSNRSLETEAFTDALTGTCNRSALTRDYDYFQGQQVSVLMMDLDGFKEINDCCGHPVGDYILQQMGMYLLDAFGKKCCYRYGGDEFLVIWPETDAGELARRVNCLQNRISRIELEGVNLKPHCSVGSVRGTCELSCDLRLMLHQADHNLYEAKKQGKNLYVDTPFQRSFAETLNVGISVGQRHSYDLC